MDLFVILRWAFKIFVLQWLVGMMYLGLKRAPPLLRVIVLALVTLGMWTYLRWAFWTVTLGIVSLFVYVVLTRILLPIAKTLVPVLVAWGITARSALVRTFKERAVQQSPDSTSHYTLLPLPKPSSCIRLLKLERGNPDDMVHCTLQVVDLDGKPTPEYVALSYTWEQNSSWWGLSIGLFKRSKRGPVKGTKKIICNGRVMMVLPNLYQALAQLRTTRSGNYWIDAVCINQSDDNERGTQVAMMDKIYKSAQSVVVWLGTCSLWASLQMRNLSTLPAGNTPRNARAWSRADSELNFIMSHILQRRWFKRVWVVQELCLARQVVFVLGEHDFQPESILNATKFTKQGPTAILGPMALGFKRTLDAASPWWGAHMKNIPGLFELRELAKQGSSLSLEDWLVLLQGKEATDKRDLVYSGIALIEPTSLSIEQDIQLQPQILPRTLQNILSPNKKLQPFIKPDYTLELPEVLLNLAACLLSKENGINNLLHITCLFQDPLSFYLPGRLKKKPYLEGPSSWIPNPGMHTSRAIKPFSVLKTRRLAASPELAPSSGTPRISANGERLFLNVVKLDTIIDDFQTPYFQSLHNFPLTALRWIDAHAAHLNEPCFLKALAQVLMGGPRDDSEDSSMGSSQGALADLCSFFDYLAWETEDKRRRNGRSLFTGKNTEVSLDVYQELKAAYPKAPWPTDENNHGPAERELSRQRFDHIAKSRMGWRKLFFTQRGYLGLGPAWMQRNDVVMHVKGASVAYIFNPVENEAEKEAKQLRKILDHEELGYTAGVKAYLEEELARCESGGGKLGNTWHFVGEVDVPGLTNDKAILKLLEGDCFETVSVL
ncbi:hypothetical protein BP6252_13717 [Coleophoma cylindrospora]|uniref:Heterokaryon incompatibility domain-containing protein n=1 Tax=Coleophoma cylindrospora TaxID=1849047 RepID=A0A3D8Q716_9HELO|nr:hypothetical protein BP6252_13717 [Coleophoma cylindrospora]